MNTKVETLPTKNPPLPANPLTEAGFENGVQRVRCILTYLGTLDQEVYKS